MLQLRCSFEKFSKEKLRMRNFLLQNFASPSQVTDLIFSMFIYHSLLNVFVIILLYCFSTAHRECFWSDNQFIQNAVLTIIWITHKPYELYTVVYVTKHIYWITIFQYNFEVLVLYLSISIMYATLYSATTTTRQFCTPLQLFDNISS